MKISVIFIGNKLTTTATIVVYCLHLQLKEILNFSCKLMKKTLPMAPLTRLGTFMLSIVVSPEYLLFLVFTTPRNGEIVIFILRMRILRFGVRLIHPRSHSSIALSPSQGFVKPELRFSLSCMFQSCHE